MLSESDILQRANRPGLFNSHNGISVTAVRDGRGRGALEVSDTSLNPHGTVHGGCLYTLADTVAGSAVASGSGQSCVTVSGTLEFLHPATGPKIQCSASPKKTGRSLWVMQVELTDQYGKMVATGTFIFMLVRPADGKMAGEARQP